MPDLHQDHVARLREVRGFLFDMDGTLVLGDQRTHRLRPLPGALDITRFLTARQVPYVVFTNGTARPPEHYAAMLREAGFALTDVQLLTPASSAVDVFLRRGHRRVMVLGTDGLRRPLADAGFELVLPEGRTAADAVLAGWYREFTMDALEAACNAVWGGARLYSSSRSVFFATADGPMMGTSRAISAMIHSLTGCRVEVVGKPSADALRSAAHRLGVPPRTLAVVGDDPELEVPMAHCGKALAVAVATGLAEAEAYDHLPEARRPHLSVHGVGELLALYRDALGDPAEPGSDRASSGARLSAAAR
jgi:HAD superfamily hydrolase (TIGR01450 family)